MTQMTFGGKLLFTLLVLSLGWASYALAFEDASCDLKLDANNESLVNTAESLDDFVETATAAPSEGPRVFNINTDKIPEASGRKRICTLTLNSSNEKEAFIQHSRDKSEQVDYIELAPSGKSRSRNEWLENDCDLLQRQKVSCDQVILSAHFGPNLYGDSGKVIDLDFLEKMSCDSACPNLFSHLSKSYLFACNTLSGNTDDHRRAENQNGLSGSDKASSQQNYVVIQMGHEASRSWAEEASESRYGKYGNGGGFGDRFMRIFSNQVKDNEIYGFTTVSDRGANSAHFITDAFRRHIPLEVEMKNANMIKKSGSLDPVSTHLKTVACQLSKYNNDPDAIMASAFDYYASKDPSREKLFPKLIDFVMDHYSSTHKPRDDYVDRADISKQPWAAKLHDNKDLKAFVMGGLSEKVFPSSTRLMWSTFAAKMGWISSEQLRTNLAQGLFGLMRPPYNPETDEDVIWYAKRYPEAIRSLNVKAMPDYISKAASVDKSRVSDLLHKIDGIAVYPDNAMVKLTDDNLRDWPYSHGRSGY